MKGKILVIISFVCIFLVGFIGWGISSNAFNNVYAMHMINKNYIDINNICFSDYCEDGFVNDYVIEDRAILSFDINIDLESIYSNYGYFFIEDDSLSMDVCLSYQLGSINYFDIISNSSVNVLYNDNFIDYELNNKKINSTIIYSDSNVKNINYLNIRFMYIFDVSDYINDSSFKDKIYSLMLNKGIPFNIKVLID